MNLIKLLTLKFFFHKNGIKLNHVHNCTAGRAVKTLSKWDWLDNPTDPLSIKVRNRFEPYCVCHYRMSWPIYHTQILRSSQTRMSHFLGSTKLKMTLFKLCDFQPLQALRTLPLCDSVWELSVGLLFELWYGILMPIGTHSSSLSTMIIII